MKLMNHFANYGNLFLEARHFYLCNYAFLLKLQGLSIDFYEELFLLKIYYEKNKMRSTEV